MMKASSAIHCYRTQIVVIIREMKMPYAWIDVAALTLFAVTWVGYSWWSAQASKTRPSLLNALDSIRDQWMRIALKRDLRVVDTGLMTTLMQSAVFFSSTTVLILGGLVAGLRFVSDGASLVDNIPFAVRASAATMELKMLTMIALFMFAFIKFSWAVRQFNFSSILVGSMPQASDARDEDVYLSERAARLVSLAGDNFTKGLRAYYFALAVLLWFVNPVLFMVGTIVVVACVYRTEFHSRTLEALQVPQTQQNG
jgi:uncharacterized membrane protein